MAKKKEDDINFDGCDYEEFIEKRAVYMRKLYKKEAEESWEKRKGNVEYTANGVKYAVLSDFNHQ